jgi:formate dehydrogenase major subunit
MVTLSIDGRSVTVPEGSTVLDAARWLGIRIPTLCHVQGLEPASSCFICAVRVEGRRTLQPSCALPVASGMVVDTSSDEVRNARRLALELLLSDHAGDCASPCADACPAGLEIPGFLAHLASGDSRSALDSIWRHLALPGALGRVCPRLCEQECRRREQDDGLAIGPLHRFATDTVLAASTPHLPPKAPPSGRSVAIIGAGPAGLSAAFYLLQAGHRATLFDAKPLPGGMLRYGIPAFRLPKHSLDAEIAVIRALGAEFRMNAHWGSDFTLSELSHSYDAVFIGIGAQLAQGLRCEGEQFALSGIDFLDAVANGTPPQLGPDVIILGGGNTAIDCARSAVRLGARSVQVLYRRTEREMPCLLSEAHAARAEGVEFRFLTAPVRLERHSTGALSLFCQRMTLGPPDSSGRPRPIPLEGSGFQLSASSVIAAIGQSVDRALPERCGLKVTSWGIAADPRTLATSIPGVFAGGDCMLGADLAVRAVAAGRLAALSIHQYLTGEPLTGEPALATVLLHPIDDAERAVIFRGIERAPRVPLPEIPIERRLASFDEVETGLEPDSVPREAARCLSCGCGKSRSCGVRSLATEYDADPERFSGARRRFSRDESHPEIVYEPGKCILCEACVRIAAQAGEPLGLAPIGRGFETAIGVPFSRPLSEALLTSARRCAEACPTAALRLR